jgi:hypothetical protein
MLGGVKKPHTLKTVTKARFLYSRQPPTSYQQQHCDTFPLLLEKAQKRSHMDGVEMLAKQRELRVSAFFGNRDEQTRPIF